MLGLRHFLYVASPSPLEGAKASCPGHVQSFLYIHPLQREMLPGIKHNQSGLSTSVHSTSDVSGGESTQVQWPEKKAGEKKAQGKCLCGGKRIIRYIR